MKALEVWGRVRTDGIHDLPTPEAVELFTADWIQAVECSDHYRRDLKSYVKCFTDSEGSLTLAQLGHALALYRSKMGDKSTMFNRTKSALQGYLKRRLGDGKPLRCPTCRQMPYFQVESQTGRVIESCACGPHIVTQERQT